MRHPTFCHCPSHLPSAAFRADLIARPFIWSAIATGAAVALTAIVRASKWAAAGTPQLWRPWMRGDLAAGLAYSVGVFLRGLAERAYLLTDL
jgi:hypothetical protein